MSASMETVNPVIKFFSSTNGSRRLFAPDCGGLEFGGNVKIITNIFLL